MKISKSRAYCDVCRFPIAPDAGVFVAPYSEMNDYDATVTWHAEHHACRTTHGYTVDIDLPITPTWIGVRLGQEIDFYEWSDRTNAKAIAEESMSAMLAERGLM